MKINQLLIDYYLDTVTVGYFNDNDVPPENLNGYANLIPVIRQKAIMHNDIEHLRLALTWLLTNKNVDLEVFNGGRYPFNAGEMRDIISYINQELFSKCDDISAEILQHVDLVSIPLEQWWQEPPINK